MRNISFGLLLLLHLSGWSQKYLSGYVIVPEGTTTFTDVLYQARDSRFKVCKVRESNGLEKEFSPGEIQGYGFVGGKFYASFPDNSSFAEVLVRGQMNLWKTPTSLYIYVDGQVIVVEESNLKVLQAKFSACENFQEKVSLTEEALLNQVISFNECIGSTPTQYSELTPSIQLEIGPQLTYLANTYFFGDSRGYDYLDRELSSSSPQVGFSLNISAPKKVRGLSLDMGIFYHTSQINEFFVEESVIANALLRAEYYDLIMEYSAITVPVAVKYSSYEKRNRIHAQVGFVSQVIIDESVRLLSESLRANEVFTNPEVSPFSMTNASGVFWGVGFGRKLKHVNLDLFVRQIRMTGIVDLINATNDQYQIVLSVSRTFKWI